MAIGAYAVPVSGTMAPGILQEFTFGPINANSWSAGADGTNAASYLRIPLACSRAIAIDSFHYSLVDNDSLSIALVQSANGAAKPSAAPITHPTTGYNRVTENSDLTLVSAYTDTTVNIHPTTGLVKNANVLKPGAKLWLYTSAAPFNLSGLFITIRYRSLIS